MLTSTLTSAEKQRLEALRSYHIMDTGTEQDYEELTELAATICGTGIALVSFTDAARQWFKSHRGLQISETERTNSFCSLATATPGEVFQVHDATQDERFKNNPLVTGEPHIVFYAGVPLVDAAGFALGTICVADKKAMHLSAQQARALRTLASQVIGKLALRREMAALKNIHFQSKKAYDEQSKAMQTAEVQREEIRHLFKNAPVAMATFIGPQFVIDLYNDKVLEFWGRSAGQVANVPLFTALPEAAGQGFEELLAKVYDTGEAFRADELPVTLLRNGIMEDTFINFIYEPLRDKDTLIYGIMVVCIEITDQVHARERIEKLNVQLGEAVSSLTLSEERVNFALEAGKMGTWYIDTHTREMIVSPRLKELFGYHADEKLSVDAAMAQVDNKYRDKVSAVMETTTNTDAPYDIEYPVTGFHDKETRWVRAVGKRYATIGNTRVEHFSGILMDITERKMDEQRRSDFIGVVSHELRTPLTSLNGYVQILKMIVSASGDNKAIADIADKAKRQIDRMQALISGFLDVARIAEGKIQINRRRFDMAALVKIAEEESLATVITHDVIFRPVEFTPVYADQDKIEQVVINIINNAVKYSPHESIINVACVTINNYARVSVSDEGIGVPAADQPHIFDRFYRVNNQQTSTISGFGIGLYICKEIINLHGGRIGVESVEGQGSTFWFEIPVLPAE